MKMVPLCQDGYSIRMGMTNYSLANQRIFLGQERNWIFHLNLRQPLENLSLPFFWANFNLEHVGLLVHDQIDELPAILP